MEARLTSKFDKNPEKECQLRDKITGVLASERAEPR
jgi:hypothetical protein